MEKLLVEFEQLNIDHLVESSHVPNLVWWYRKLTNRTINDDATVSREFIIIWHYNLLNNIKIISSTLQQEEQHLLVVMDAEQLAQLVANTKAQEVEVVSCQTL